MDSKKLISLYFCGLLKEDEFRQLSDWLQQDEANLQEFVEESFVQRCLYDLFSGNSISQNIKNQILNTEMPDNRSGDSELWKALLETERTSPTVDVPQPQAKPVPIQKVENPNPKYLHFKKSSFVHLVLTAAALVLLILSVRFTPDPQGIEVATLTDSIAVQWADSGPSPANGWRFTTGYTSHYLQKGIVKLEFDNNTRLVIEAPAEFQILTKDQIHLAYGRLYASVPQEAIGFTVDTLSGKVIDLGTEFGINAAIDGSISLHVFKGKTILNTGKRFEKLSQILMAGDAKRVVAQTLTVSSVEPDQGQFVREIHSKGNFVWKSQGRLDLADIVGGGNGLGTGKLGKWINIGSGKDGTSYFRQDGERIQGSGGRNTDYQFHPALHLSYVDGVFCPDVEKGPFAVSSAGHLWADCPNTSGIYFEDIYNGSEMKQRKAFYELTFDDQPYGTREHPAIAIHANAGITFDLNALRADMPGIEIARFRARCGLTKGALKLTDANKMDFWVLIDGQTRFKAIGRENTLPADITVEIKPQDRFLTLVSTDGGLDAGYDWGFFAEPHLEIVPTE